MNLAARIEHTLLAPTAKKDDFITLFDQAIEHGFGGVCIPPYAVHEAHNYLDEHEINVVTVIGFPLGYQATSVRATEARKCLEDGADELDVVMNLSLFKSEAYAAVQNDLTTLASICHQRDAKLKVIIETAYLDKKELKTACDICVAAEADFVKTSTGFAPSGAQLEDVKAMRKWLPETMQIKASGGIRNHQQALAFVEAGADRIGASAGIALLS